MKMYLIAITLLLNFKVMAANNMYSSNFILNPEYMNIEDGAPTFLGTIAFEARFIPGNGFCSTYYKGKKTECAG